MSRLNLVRIQRKGLTYEYVSRDLDYSLERLECLIEQGYSDARDVLSARSQRKQREKPGCRRVPTVAMVHCSA